MKPWYCTLTDLGSGNYAYSSVNHVDVYHNGNFTKIERAISGFSTATCDPAYPSCSTCASPANATTR